MNGGKMKSFGTESSRPAEDGGILAGENGVGAMLPMDSPVEAQAAAQHLQPEESDRAAAAAEEDKEDEKGGEREVGDEGDKNGDHHIEEADGAAKEGEIQRPQLDEGFYELEAIRKKRIRKGKIQYLIKWRGWPESTSTWEPIENLSSCPYVIDAFEERSRARSGKRSVHGRKRKFSTTLTETKKKQHHSTAAAKDTTHTETKEKQQPSTPAAADSTHTETKKNQCCFIPSAKDTTHTETKKKRRHSTAAAKDTAPAMKATIMGEPVPFLCLDDSSIKNHVNNNVLDKSVAHSEEAQIPAAKDSTHTETKKEQCHSIPAAKDTTHTETKKKRRRSSAAAKDNAPATKARIIEEPVPFPCLDDSSIKNHVNNNVSSPKNSERSGGLNEHLLLTDCSSLDQPVVHSEEAQKPGDCMISGFPDSNITQSVQSGPRTGAKKRKPGSVRKFKKDSCTDVSDDAPVIIRTTGGSVAPFAREDFEDMCNITQIVEPINYQDSVSKDVQDVAITFVAKRSDGKEVTVNNGFLKANNPLLQLISFYEQLLKRLPIPLS